MDPLEIDLIRRAYAVANDLVSRQDVKTRISEWHALDMTQRKMADILRQGQPLA